jgi:hypothetical protein
MPNIHLELSQQPSYRAASPLARLGVALPLEPMGQGFKDMSPAVEAFEELALAGRIRHGGSRRPARRS